MRSLQESNSWASLESKRVKMSCLSSQIDKTSSIHLIAIAGRMELTPRVLKVKFRDQAQPKVAFKSIRISLEDVRSQTSLHSDWRNLDHRPAKVTTQAQILSSRANPSCQGIDHRKTPPSNREAAYLTLTVKLLSPSSRMQSRTYSTTDGVV